MYFQLRNFTYVASFTDLTPCERLFVIEELGIEEEQNPYAMRDLYAACSCIDDLRQNGVSRRNPRKSGDAAWAAGEYDEAERLYLAPARSASREEYRTARHGPDWDRLITLAFSRGRWADAVNYFLEAPFGPVPLIAELGPEHESLQAKIHKDMEGKIGLNDGAHLVSARRYIELAVIACARSGGDAVNVASKLIDAFGLNDESVEGQFHLAKHKSDKDIIRLQGTVRPKEAKGEARSKGTALKIGNTERAATAIKFLKDLLPSLEGAVRELDEFFCTGTETSLASAINLAISSGVPSLSRMAIEDVFMNSRLNDNEYWDADLDQQNTHIRRVFAAVTFDSWVRRTYAGTVFDTSFAMGDRIAPEDLVSVAIVHLRARDSILNGRTMRSIRPPLDWLMSPEIGALPFDGGKLEQVREWAEIAASTWWDERGHRRYEEARSDAGEVCIGSLELSPFGRVLRQRKPGNLIVDFLNELGARWEIEIGDVRWKSEQRLATLISAKLKPLGIDIERHFRPMWLGAQHLDIHLPTLGVAIEYQGEQHYRPIDYFGGAEGFERRLELDRRKRLLCEANGVQLIEVRFDEPIDKRVKEIVRQLNV